MFFGYFLNTKKVTPSADSVIGPAKAGDFPLFPHAASVPAPALAPIRSHFACGETGLAGHRPHRGRRFAVPVTAAPRRGPNGKTPALAPVRSHFACGETGLAGRCPHWGQRARSPIFAPLKCGPALAPRPLPPFRLRTSSFSAHFSAQKCPRRAMLSHSSRRGRPFALFHRAGAAFGTLTAAAAPPPSWSRRPLHIPCPPF